MKRDMDYVRDLLLLIEASDGEITSSDLLPDDADDRDEQRLESHMRLLVEDARLLDGNKYETMQDTTWLRLRLTWRGHEYLETVRDPEVWAKTKEGAAKIGDFSIDLLKALAKGYVKEKAKRLTGIDLEL